MKLLRLFSLCALPVSPVGAKTIVETVADNSQLSTLASLMQNSFPAYDSGLSGNETLFAPTDNAFGMYFEQELLANLLTPEWKTHTRTFLHYHTVREQRLNAADFEDGQSVESWTRSPLGSPFPLLINLDPLRVNEVAVVTEGDIEADDGVIHIVDTVLHPPFFTDLFTSAKFTPQLTTFVELIELAMLVEIFQESGPLTVLAPTDDAFAVLGEDKLAELRAPENRPSFGIPGAQSCAAGECVFLHLCQSIVCYKLQQ